jgi:uncharacterized protein
MLEDTLGGVHDTVIAACDKYRYKFLGVEEYHDTCEDIMVSAMKSFGLEAPEAPGSLNFMNIPVKEDHSSRFEAPVSTPGCYVLFKAEMDLVIALSICP